MKTFASKNSYTQNSILEHTPIYDMAAYQQRQKQLKYQRIRKNIFDICTFFCALVFTFSILFLGE
ncbi:hypothetical protein [Acinetobacter seifertii]|uniref:Uncharacterized protein n=1 Tax=Acinetobacter seifertii TaxID=1530123 RepID=A0A7H2V913_9GAMM|nr:hypothetical protein [Acinetobacter seifertii]QNX72846.1 hypothetical protein IC776_02795 [Acinetobacter seifertii]